LERLDIDLCKYDGPHAVTLMIWLLLAPNIRELSLKEITIDDQVKLAIELSELLKTHEFLRPICVRLVQVKLFYDLDTHHREMQQKLFLLFSEIFPKAIDFIRKSIFPIVSKSSIIQTNIHYVPSRLGCPR
jgi:hypothetical protein